MTEQEWVETLRPFVINSLPRNMIVKTGFYLPYELHVSSYPEESVDAPRTGRHLYQTDLMIGEYVGRSTDWRPRIVVEFKLRLHTHDALTYSAKAATHKNVHPYLRYGIVMAISETSVPVRLMRHGHQFDFMLTLASKKLAGQDRDRLRKLLREEIRASRTIDALLSGKSGITLVHRKLVTTHQ